MVVDKISTRLEEHIKDFELYVIFVVEYLATLYNGSVNVKSIEDVYMLLIIW